MNIKTLRVASVFSGIGAFEQALKLMKLPHEIKFACDNGERTLKLIAIFLVGYIRSNRDDDDYDDY